MLLLSGSSTVPPVFVQIITPIVNVRYFDFDYGYSKNKKIIVNNIDTKHFQDLILRWVKGWFLHYQHNVVKQDWHPAISVV